ncbi:hypothetical protein BCR33DRAFT_131814 [Rhizoclosmatium globosum]|uniref:G-protein coupled receptors family 3 profile domain-containing protein n=1 Tax=Rhizoclosmatium globosum TaxID=329046 RepID=A0A1Y2CJT8_9FUNG|nr:hypothetical protein BCR33DRAFT_131814 [Rhizoclosmatium globosum]|eukprot:ORY46595.1 hypothetical protein BCR33DRAFT_131814 [Rhizoclosmatium globosum]
MTQAVDEIQKPWGVQFSPVDAANGYNMNFLYDCVRLLAAGMNKILNNSSTAPSILQSAKFREMLNSTLFEDTGYRGMIGDPVRLTKGGDVASIGQVAFVDGTSDFNVIPFAYTDMALSRLFKVNGTPPMFFDGTATPPLDGTIILTEKIISQSSVYGKLLLSLAIVGLSMVVLFLIVLVVAQTMPLFHTTSIPFLTTLTIGTALSFISNFMYFGVESVGNCEMRIWFQVTAFSLIVGSIICRNTKVIFVYNSSQRLKKWTVNDSTWMIPLLGIVIIEQILLVVWFRLSNVSIKSLVTNDSIQYACACGFYGPTYALVVFNSVLVVSLFSIAYYTVDVPVVNSEFTLILIFSIMTCIFVILALIMNQSFASETTKQFNIAILIWILTISPLSMQFIPRALEMYGDRQRTSLYKIMFRTVGSTTSSQQQTSQLSSQLRSFSTPLDNRTTMSTISRGDAAKVDTGDQIKSSDLRTGQHRTIVSSFVHPTNSLPRKQVSSGVTSLMLIPHLTLSYL